MSLTATAPFAATEDATLPLADNATWDDAHADARVLGRQDDGPWPVVAIAYDEAFRETMDYFRLVLRRGETSARALALTTRVVTVNPANYTAWHRRRQCLDAHAHHDKVDQEEERAFCDEAARRTPKNYQIWHQRRWLIDRLGQAAAVAELEFTAEIFETDAKNYHAWASRQYAVRAFNLWEGELDFTDYLLSVDVRNNSAWSHRWFVVTRGDNATTSLPTETIESEMTYAWSCALATPRNECPYNYLRGLAKKHPRGFAALPWLSATATSTTPLTEATILSPPPSRTSENGGGFPALEAYAVDVLAAHHRLADARAVCHKLATATDKVRAEYWTWRASTLSN